jgi:aspartate aminotransferase-like enzyme
VNLRTPGPTPMPDSVAQALSQPMINHRGPEFAALLQEVTVGLQTIFQTKNDLLLLTSSGTGGLEAAIVNHLSPGERVLAVSIGNFGDRFATIAKRYGTDVQDLVFANGEAADPQLIADCLAADPTIKAVLVTHNETSTGVTNDLQSIAAVVRQADRLLLVDGISSVGSLEVRTDDWGIDVLVAGSQKGWMVPPGVCMVSVSPRAWEASKSARLPRYYWDLEAAKKSAAKGQTPYTPAITVMYGFREALRQMLAEGLDSIFARHRRYGAHTRAGVAALGLRLVPVDERRASDTVTAFWLPAGMNDEETMEVLRSRYNVVLAGGQGELAGQILRIGHMGHVSEAEIDEALGALKQVLAGRTAAAR